MISRWRMFLYVCTNTHRVATCMWDLYIIKETDFPFSVKLYFSSPIRWRTEFGKIGLLNISIYFLLKIALGFPYRDTTKDQFSQLSNALFSTIRIVLPCSPQNNIIVFNIFRIFFQIDIFLPCPLRVLHAWRCHQICHRTILLKCVNFTHRTFITHNSFLSLFNKNYSIFDCEDRALSAVRWFFYKTILQETDGFILVFLYIYIISD